MPNQTVLLPVGATEEHGPHLAAGVDAMIAEQLVDLACEFEAK